jgi:hypothetical protein
LERLESTSSGDVASEGVKGSAKQDGGEQNSGSISYSMVDDKSAMVSESAVEATDGLEDCSPVQEDGKGKVAAEVDEADSVLVAGLGEPEWQGAEEVRDCSALFMLSFAKCRIAPPRAFTSSCSRFVTDCCDTKPKGPGNVLNKCFQAGAWLRKWSLHQVSMHRF